MCSRLCLYSILLVSISINYLFSQSFERQVTFAERNLSGPRLGVTYIPGNGELVQDLKERNIGQSLSQFGWHFEWQVVPEGGGPQFVVELVPLIAGVEYGKLIPSGTIAMGIRMPNGIEFGMGPNLLFGGKDIINSALVIAVGKSIDYSGVSIPLNLVFATNPSGNRISFIFGYAIAR